MTFVVENLDYSFILFYFIIFLAFSLFHFGSSLVASTVTTCKSVRHTWLKKFLQKSQNNSYLTWRHTGLNPNLCQKIKLCFSTATEQIKEDIIHFSFLLFYILLYLRGSHIWYFQIIYIFYLMLHEKNDQCLFGMKNLKIILTLKKKTVF